MVVLVMGVHERTEEYQAAVLLGSLAGNDDNRVAIVKAGGIAPLVALARARRWWRWLAAARTGRKACRARGVADASRCLLS